MGKTKRITDKEFLTVLRNNAGLFARTAKAIELEFNIKYSRQAVRQRALKHPNEMEDIEEQNLDLAEEGLHWMMKANNKDVRTRLRAIELYLKTRGKKRGYVEKVEFENTNPQQIIIQGENAKAGLDSIPNPDE